jgi:hypothetical protein
MHFCVFYSISAAGCPFCASVLFILYSMLATLHMTEETPGAVSSVYVYTHVYSMKNNFLIIKISSYFSFFLLRQLSTNGSWSALPDVQSEKGYPAGGRARAWGGG